MKKMNTMNLKAQYKRLFEGKARSNDQKLLKEDYSTMRLKSNIDTKWSDKQAMIDDMSQWLEGVYASGDWSNGASIQAALTSGQQTARTLLKDLSQ